MAESAPAHRIVRFGVFAVDLRAGELHRQGLKIKLQEKPFQVLALLLEHPGGVVTREELQQRLWPGDTFVDFDHSLNIAVAKLREALGDSADIPRYVETLPRRGYRFIAPVEGQEQAVAEPRARLRSVWIAALALVALAAVVIGLNVGGLRDRLLGWPQPGEITSIAVLPLKNLSGDPEQDYFADGMTEALITALSKIEALKVISRTSAMRYKGSDKPLPEIARELGVDALVEGSVLRAGDQVRITAQLISAATDENLWAESYQRDLTDILALQNDVARAIAREIKIAVTREEEARLASASLVNPEAFELYLKGRHFWNKRTPDGIEKGLEYFQQAIEKDPGYALAYTGVADSYNMLARFEFLKPGEAYPRAKAAARTALEIDDMLAEAHTSLAQPMGIFDWDWAGAEKAFRRAIELNPSYATAHQWYGGYLVRVGRLDEGLEQKVKARQLDPLSGVMLTSMAWAFYLARQYDQAIKELQGALELYPDFAWGHSVLGAVYQQKGMYDDAIAELQKAVALSGRSPRFLKELGHAYGMAGKRREALKVLRELEEMSKQRYVPPDAMAVVYLGLGDKDQAFEWLTKAYEERSHSIAFLKVDAIFDPLRSDPRFQSLLRRMNFPE